jgi:hypothetical protein
MAAAAKKMAAASKRSEEIETGSSEMAKMAYGISVSGESVNNESQHHLAAIENQ